MADSTLNSALSGLIDEMKPFGRNLNNESPRISRGLGYSPIWIRLSSRCRIANAPV